MTLACSEPPLPAVGLAFEYVPDTVRAGTALAPPAVVSLLNSKGEPASGATDLVTLTLGAPDSAVLLRGTTRRGATDGRAVFDDLRIDRAGQAVLVAVASGLDSARSSAIRVMADWARTMRFLAQPSDVRWGDTIVPAPAVELIDQYGNRVPEYARVMFVRLEDSLTILDQRQVSDGVARFPSIRPMYPGPAFRLEAKLYVEFPRPTLSEPFAVLWHEPTHMRIVRGAPEFAYWGEPFQVETEILDDGGFVTVQASGMPVHASLVDAPDGVVLVGDTTVLSVEGRVAFTLTASRSGYGYRLILSAPGMSDLWAGQFHLVFPADRVVAGGAHSCLYRIGGLVYCWGDDAFGQLGDGSAGEPRAIPEIIHGGFAALELAAGDVHTCARTTASTASCWGDNSYGQSGIEATSTDTPTPVQGGLQMLETLAAGARHTCGIFTSLGLYCWGDHSSGQLGIGSMGGSSSVPVPVAGQASFTAVSAGGAHTCGLTADGAAYCWGDNAHGQLGDGNFGVDSDTAVAVTGGLTFSKIAAGLEHTCALAAGVETQVYCWGRNDVGQLGSTVVAVDPAAPIPVSLSTVVTGLSAGRHHTCVSTWTSDFCWGDNSHGQLGAGTVGGWSVLPTGGGGMFSIDSVAAGGTHTCGVNRLGVVCWGDNSTGQVGSGIVGGTYPVQRLIHDPEG